MPFKSETTFPHDWIAPGEFIYGSSGRNRELCLGPVFKKRWFRGRRAYWLRHLIANIRRRVFRYPPLFWVKDRDKLRHWCPNSGLWTPRALWYEVKDA